MRPTSQKDVQDLVRQSGSVAIYGRRSKTEFCGKVDADAEIDTTSLVGITEFAPDDQFIEAYAGTTLTEIQEAASARGLGIPLPDPSEFGDAAAGFWGTLGGLVAMNAPHGLFAQCGGPRDWILAATIVTSDGTVVKAGSRAVKNVAGYDIPKLLVGSRGAFGAICNVTLKLWPVRAVPIPQIEVRSQERPNWIQRTRQTDFPTLLQSAAPWLVATDPVSATLWARVPEGITLPRFSHDWVWAQGSTQATGTDLEKRLKASLDPEGKLNPGVFGWI